MIIHLTSLPEKSPQRDIPKANDLQDANNKFYNGGTNKIKQQKATNPLKGNTEIPAETQEKNQKHLQVRVRKIQKIPAQELMKLEK